ncbi:response regulator transcription factor [Neobacillus muris]|uniref:response regulator transcription factor n=1 Tax=Neobacillus muris TaxID=2941334 RepID=UPI00203F8AA3|nr:response regulator transcription factor [Neobacillus muris]
MIKILMAEDDPAIQELVDIYLDKQVYQIWFASDGEETIKMFNDIHPDLLLVDINMPKKNGIEVCKEIRKTSMIPVLFLSSRDDEKDIIEGLMAGADDYITKPFNMNVLLARIETNVRYKSPNKWVEKPLRLGRLELNFQTFAVKMNGIKVELNPRELDLLFYLAAHPNEVIGADKLYEEVWRADSLGDTLTVAVHISRIRKKVEEDPKNPKIIKTVKGKGYMLAAN